MDSLRTNAIPHANCDGCSPDVFSPIIPSAAQNSVRRLARLRHLIAGFIAIGVAFMGTGSALAIDSVQEGPDKCAGVEVTLKFPRSETIARALEVTRALQASGDVLRVHYGVSEGDDASAEVIHCPETTAETLKRIIDTLTAASIEDVKVKQFEPSCD